MDAAPASDASASNASVRDAAPTRSCSPFAAGKFAISLEGDYAHSFDLSQERIETGSLGVHYYFADNWSIGLEFSGTSIQQSGPDPLIGGGDIRIRNHLLQSGPFSIFIDGGAGIAQATEPTPPGGTYFNFTLQAGAGVTWQLNDHLFLMGGARYWHLSNAHLEGAERNPSINAVQGFVGLMWMIN